MIIPNTTVAYAIFCHRCDTRDGGEGYIDYAPVHGWDVSSGVAIPIFSEREYIHKVRPVYAMNSGVVIDSEGDAHESVRAFEAHWKRMCEWMTAIEDNAAG